MCLDRCGEFARSLNDDSSGRDLSDSSSSGDVDRSYQPLHSKLVPKAMVSTGTNSFRTSFILCGHYPPIPQDPLPSMTNKVYLVAQIHGTLKEISSWADLGTYEW